MLKIGVLGAGHLGRIHLDLLSKMKEFELVGFYDPDLSRAMKAQKDFGVPAFGTMAELIGSVDAVDVVTPTLDHFACASAAMRRSKHVFIEKPVTHTLEEAKKLIALANEAGVKAQVGHVERFNPAFLAALPHINDPMFIEAHRLAQFNPRGTDVPVVLDLMIHDIDIIVSIVKSNIRKIHASGVAVVSETPDIANVRLEFDNGCVANMTASRISMKNMRKTRIFRRDAYISIDFLEKEANVISLRNAGENESESAMILDLGEGKQKKVINFEKPDVGDTNAIRSELEAFAQSILKDTTPKVTLEEAYLSLDIAHRILDKLKLMPDLKEGLAV